MLALADIARIEERRLVAGLAAVAPESRRLGSGLLCRGAPGTWINLAVGLGMDDLPPTQADLNPTDAHAQVESLITWFEEVGIEPRVELCPFAHRGFVAALAARGFVPRGFENAFFYDLNSTRDTPASLPHHPLPASVTVEPIDRASESARWAYARAIAAGFAADGKPATEEDAALWARVIRADFVSAFAAVVGGRIVGGGAIEIHPKVVGDATAAALFGLSVLPEFRRKGIQSALIAARLRAAANAGCTIATIGARPGVATERNARRMGFQVAYTKVVLVRPGPGLTPHE